VLLGSAVSIVLAGILVTTLARRNRRLHPRREVSAAGPGA
jgi:hypothetical protein